MRRTRGGRLRSGQPVFDPEAVYEQAPNTSNEPGAGSVSVPTNPPAEFIVPRISIAAEDPGDAARKRSANPLLSVTEPLTGRGWVEGGSRQVLPVVTVPSERTAN